MSRPLSRRVSYNSIWKRCGHQSEELIIISYNILTSAAMLCVLNGSAPFPWNLQPYEHHMYRYQAFPPLDWGDGGQDKNAQKEGGARCLGDFSKMLVEFSKMFVAWREKCASGTICLKGLRLKKMVFTCIFAACSCFKAKSSFLL